MKDLLKELQEKELNLLQKRADMPFWFFIKIYFIESEIKVLQDITNHIKKYYLTK